MNVGTISKLPGEKVTRVVDFANSLLTSEQLTSVAVTALLGATDVTGTIIVPASAIIQAGTARVQFQVQAGASGSVYDIHVVVNTDGSNLYEAVIELLVGPTDKDSLVAFWPDVLTQFPADTVDQQISVYISRAVTLLNAFNDYDTSNVDYTTIFDLATNMLVRRLVYYDKHPASSAEPAGVTAESVRGISYSKLTSGSTLRDLLGTEIISVLGTILTNDGTGVDFSAKISDLVFLRPVLDHTDGESQTGYYDSILDDGVDLTLSEKLARVYGLRRIQP